MEVKEESNSAKKEEAPASYQSPPRVSDPAEPSLADTAAPVPVSGAVSGGVKKKRGRPRKYGPDGVALSPMPISASIPLAGEIPTWRPQPQQRGKVMPVEIIKKKQKFEYENPAEKMASLVGANFTPHIITVNPGEDITMKVMSLSQQGSRAVCVLSATGTISNVSLRQPSSYGGTLTYEGGRFEILSLSGSYMPVERGGATSTSGGMSVSLAGSDGRVLGGGLAGLLVAASPVQVVVGSFVPGQEHKRPKNQKRLEEAVVVSVSDHPFIRRQQTTTTLAFGGAKPPIITAAEEDNIVPVQSIANSLGGNKISFSSSSSANESNGYGLLT